MTEALCILFTGRSGAGKDTVGRGVAHELRRRGQACALLDAASVEHHLEPGTAAIVWCCGLLVTNGATPLVTVSMPTRAERDALREAVPGFVEVFLDAPATVCTQRTGRADDSYEEPHAADLRVPTHDREPVASIAQVMSFLEARSPRGPDAGPQ